MEKKNREIKFLIEGITCTGCAMDMENIMLDMDGVIDASLNFAEGVFTIQYDPEEIGAKTIAKKVQNMGFGTKLITE
ncbi:MAG: heavy-metal-associated domain-containing protein [Deltaproteobacteria bacterium]|nr:heavy-metal-associated domain-containing protein [Deltaproteobacteria bacterium]